tara:strand:- start:84 stop:758 length:675 start_codon:yes stop_codon:yes gene_type:complete
MKRIRRLSIKSKSNEELTNLTLEKPILKNSFSDSELYTKELDRNRFEIEGDGPLGIIFENYKGKMVVKNIEPNTVASEYFIEKNMILTEIESYNCDNLTYKEQLEIIKLRWCKYSKISLKFDDPVIIPDKKSDLYKFLGEEFIKYYKDFELLGFSSFNDVKFIDMQDLINMKMTTSERLIMKQKIVNSSKPNIKVYISPYLSEREKQREIDKFSDKTKYDIIFL